MTGGTDGPHSQSRLLQKLKGDVSTDWLSRSIFKVPNHLRRISRQAYEPQVVSIGPYHHGKGQLKKMEEYKMFYLKLLLSRTESSLERYETALKHMEEEARKFYSEPLNHIRGDKFVEMMLLDGCFVIELIRKSAMKKQRDEKDHLLTHFILRRAMLDLLLVENQLPFFILSELFNMTVMPNDEAKEFVDMAINFLSIVMPLPGPQIRRPKNQDIKHLLGLLHDCWTFSPACQEVTVTRSLGDLESLEEVRSQCPMSNGCSVCCFSSIGKMSAPFVSFSPPNPTVLEIDAQGSNPSTSFPSPKSSEEGEIEPASLVGFWPFNKLRLWCKCASDSNSKEWRFISPATELNEAGINFKKIEGRLFDIKFQKGEMSIPTLSINDDSESILRNLVAYEQCFKRTSQKHFRRTSPKSFTDYITFMDCLINTGKDVELLHRCGVIDNWLGDHEAVAAILNKLRDSVLISKKDFSYAETFEKVNEYCDRNWNHWKANLWHNYFNTPWAGISFLAAVFLLLLTVLQSVYAVLSYQFK